MVLIKLKADVFGRNKILYKQDFIHFFLFFTESSCRPQGDVQRVEKGKGRC